MDIKFKRIVISALILFFVLPAYGCKKAVKDVKVEESTNEIVKFSLINGTGVVKADTIFYINLEKTAGADLKIGEKVVLTGESDNMYSCIYGNIKGYVVKSALEVTLSEKSPDVVDIYGDSQIIIKEHVKEEITTPSNENLYSTQTTAAPPESLYTTAKTNIAVLSNTIIESINAQRQSAGLGYLSVDKFLSEKAAYYCDIFAARKYIYKIEGYSIQAVGKTTKRDRLSGVGKTAYKTIIGFSDKNTSKIGAAVIESDDGAYYYCVLAG